MSKAHEPLHRTAKENEGDPPHHWNRGELDKAGERKGIDAQDHNIFFIAVEMTRMPMAISDPRLPDNPLVFVNQAFLELTGYDREEVIGRNCRFLQGPETDSNVTDQVRKAICDQRAVAVELLNHRKDGSTFWNNLFIGPVFNEEGELIYFFASQLDVTDRLRHDNDMRQSQKMEAIGQLTAGLAHDFNNMLMVIMGNLEMVKNFEHPPRVSRLLDRIDVAAQKGSKITKQLLSFARKSRLDSKLVNLNQLIMGFNEILDQTLGSQVELELALKSKLPSCLLDSTQLEMALLNVLINARDAMPNGGEVTVRTSVLKLNGNAAARHLLPGEYVVLEVTDTGDGIPDVIIDRVTEPFFTTKPTEKGTGLGLSMVQGFVQQSGGRLEIESQVGRGTTIRMIFPMDKGEADPLAVDAAKPQASMPGGSETILLVEDNEDVMSLGRSILSNLGYRVRTATDGQKALEEIERDPQIDLLFTDIVMPGSINGLVLSEYVRSNLPHCEVLLTTGYIEDLVSNTPRKHDTALDVLGKPYRAIDLADRVRTALRRRKHPRKLLQMPE